MDKNEFIRIFDGDSGEWDGDNALQGLKIIEKYVPGRGIEGAEHEIIYSVTVDQLVEGGITKEDAEELRRLNWMVEYGAMACFV